MNEDRKRPEYIDEQDGYNRVTLIRGLKLAEGATKVVTMREPSVADMERHQDSKKSAATAEVELFANLCELAPSDIRSLSFRDYGRLQESFALFTS